MSLKAKLEAVIYAADEPVTLAQLAGLFADEALEWKTEQETAAAAALADTTATESGNAPALGEAFAYLELDQESIEPTNGAAETAGEPVAEPTPEAGEASAEGEVGSAAVTGDSAVMDEAAAEAEAKRASRLRDREARGVIRKVLDELIAEYAADGRGIEIREIAGGYRMATKPECHDAVRMFVKSQKPALKLSLPALETLAVIAYKQPVTVPEVNEIRGVDSSGVFGSLLARKLIATAGRKPVIGRPILYKTTREFLLRFGLKDVTELPSMEEFEKMAASELDEAELTPADETGVAAEEFNEDMKVEADAAANGEHAESESDPQENAPSGAE